MSGSVAESNIEHPLVTVVTVVLNGQPFISRCLESVLIQDYPNIEHLVLDGVSNDGTVDVLRQYDQRIALWKSEPDKGVYDAWNKALLEARGEWICFLGADDAFLPGAISSYMALAAQNPKAEYLSSRLRWVHPSGYETLRGSEWTWRKFSKWMCVAHVGSMHRRSLFDRLGKFDTSYRITADYEFLLRARNELGAAYMPVTTVIMQAGGISDNASALSEAKRAKICTGGRNWLLAEWEFRSASVKLMLRPLRQAISRIAG